MSKDYCCYVQERSLTNHKKAWPLLKKALCVYENLSLESLKNLKSREENASLGHEKKCLEHLQTLNWIVLHKICFRPLSHSCAVGVWILWGAIVIAELVVPKYFCKNIFTQTTQPTTPTLGKLQIRPNYSQIDVYISHVAVTKICMTAFSDYGIFQAKIKSTAFTKKFREICAILSRTAWKNLQ